MTSRTEYLRSIMPIRPALKKRLPMLHKFIRTPIGYKLGVKLCGFLLKTGRLCSLLGKLLFEEFGLLHEERQALAQHGGAAVFLDEPLDRVEQSH